MTFVALLNICRSCRKIRNRISCSSITLPTPFNQRAKTRLYNSDTVHKSSEPLKKRDFKGPSLEHFIANSHSSSNTTAEELTSDPMVSAYMSHTDVNEKRKVFIETYGCQMNVNDTEIAWSILKDNGFEKAVTADESDVTLLMTCSIREGAEQKIWHRLEYLKFLKKKKKQGRMPFKIGILGCMAERLKKKLVEQEQSVDVVCGPDAYRDLPRLLAVTEGGLPSINVQLSLEETYADVVPVRLNQDSTSAFVSIMRGCDNMCTYCIVPFTRGRERSRDIESIVQEVEALSEQGIKEVTLLGQNVNSYRDTSKPTIAPTGSMSRGFRTVYKPKQGGLRFADLLDRVSQVDPEMRIRFTSPHPKDFPDEVLQLIRERANVCTQLHLPAQSGSSRVLAAMRRGYTHEAYLDLVHHIRQILPDVALSSDFIAGFCGETEEDHELTKALMEDVKYNFAFCFPYSMRGKTHAYHRLTDDVPEDVKQRRHMELVDIFRRHALKRHHGQIGNTQLVLVEGESKRSASDLAGRNDANTKVIFPAEPLPTSDGSDPRAAAPGDYVAVKITDGSSQVLKAQPLYLTTLQSFNRQAALRQESVAC